MVANNPAMFNGDAEVASTFTQPATLPAYELAAIDHLNATHPDTRVLAIPGDDFASYRWGDTVDTPQPALLDPAVRHPRAADHGLEATADTLYAIDAPIQTGIEDWTGLAPMARLMSAGDVLVEYDQAYEHYGVPQPRVLAQDLADDPGRPVRSRQLRHAGAQRGHSLHPRRAGPGLDSQPRLDRRRW